MRCYCTICRKTMGSAGYGINLSADASTLKVKGQADVRIYRATLKRKGERVQSKHQRHFCGKCGCHLWAFHEDWPDLIHPVAGALDTELPAAEKNVHIMLGSKMKWAPVEGNADDPHFEEYPDKSLKDFHDENGWTVA